MNNDKFLDNLENTCLDNMSMLYNGKDDKFKYYIMSYYTSYMYFLITGYEIFDKLDFIADHKDIYEEIKYYDYIYNNKLLENILSFKDIILDCEKEINNILTVPINKWNSENKLCSKKIRKRRSF